MKQSKRTGDPVEEKWREVVYEIMEVKVDIGIDKLLRRGVKRMKKRDPRPDAELREELRNVLDFGLLKGYTLNEDRSRMRKDDKNLHVQENESEQEPEAPPQEMQETPEERPEERPEEEEAPQERQEDPQSVQHTQQQEQAVPQRMPVSSGGFATWRESLKRVNVKTGRFSKKEEDALREAVIQYAMSTGHSTTDFSWIIGKKDYNENEIRGVWTAVAQALPQRTIKAVAAAGVRMFHPFANKGAWTPNEDATLLALVNSDDKKWTKISHEIERTPEACRLRWREIHAEEWKSGKWEKDEEDRLVEAVREYGGERSLKGNSTVPIVDSQGNVIAPPNRRMILDDVNWEAVVRHVKTRSRIQCVKKWYIRMAPTLEDRGEWAKEDDKNLLKSLWELSKRENNLMEHEVKWDTIVSGRSADQCKRRWAFMRQAIKGHKDFEFPDLITELMKTLMPKVFQESNRNE